MNEEPSCSSGDKVVVVKKELKRSDSSEECSICRGDKLVDRTVLNSCIHEFCYKCITEWLKYSNGPICPMCKQHIDTISHNLDKDPVTVEDAVAINTIARREEARPRVHANLVNVRRILQVVCRKYRRRANECDTDIEFTRRSQRNGGQITRYEESKRALIQQLNSLQLLKDEITEGSAKEFIILQTAFRKLIYIERLTPVFPQNSNVVYLSPSLASSISGFREKLVPFLIEEFKAIPAKYSSKEPATIPTKFLHDIYNGTDEKVANAVVDLILEYGIEKSQSTARLSEVTSASIDDVLLLSAHIRAFAKHEGSFLDFLKGVDYTLRGHIPSASTQNANNFEVVLDSDDDDDDDDDVEDVDNPVLPPISNISRPSYQLLQAISTFSGMNPAMTNYFPPLPPQPTDLRRTFIRGNQSTSESDGDSQMYARPSLLRSTVSPFVGSFIDHGPLGSSRAQSWNELTSDYPRRQMGNRRSNDDDSIVVISDDESPPRPPPQSSSRYANETITLDDSVRSESRPSSSRSSRHHSHRSSRRGEKRRLSREGEESRNKRREYDLPTGFSDSMYKLLSKYGMSRSGDIEKVKYAGEIALKRLKNESNRDNNDSVANSSMTSTSSDDRQKWNEPRSSNQL